MTPYLLPKEGPRLKLTLPYEGATWVEHPSPCPKCSAAPLKLYSREKHPSADDRAWEGTARCYACREDVGTLRVEMRTLFGVTEDWAMLDNARCRVY